MERGLEAGVSEAPQPLILTATLDDASQAGFDALRERYFPPERNMIPAHLSLFNQLPGERLEDIGEDLARTAAEQSRIPARVEGLRFLGKGVAYTLHAPGLVGLRHGLARGWEPWLGPQDRRKLSPHVTVQNKVDPQAARELHDYLRATFEPREATIEGVTLWRYLGGPWELVQEFRFRGPPPLA